MGSSYAMTVGGVLSDVGGRLHDARWAAYYAKGVGTLRSKNCRSEQ